MFEPHTILKRQYIKYITAAADSHLEALQLVNEIRECRQDRDENIKKAKAFMQTLEDLGASDEEVMALWVKWGSLKDDPK